MTAHPETTDRGIRWAVLSAYARALTPGDLRTAVRMYAFNLRPAIGKQGEALVAAADLGLTKFGELTLKGLAAAGTYLAEILKTAPAPCAADPLKAEHSEIYRPYLDFLAQILARDIPNPKVRENVASLHEEVRALVDGAAYTDLNVLSLVQTAGYFESGVNLDTGQFTR